MTQLLVILLAVWSMQVALAQPVPDSAASMDAPSSRHALERSRIRIERSVLESQFATENTACYAKFWVNSCLDGARARHNEKLADLRRQEISINEQERKLKGAEQIRKTEEKASPQKQQQAADQRAASAAAFEARIAKQKEKAESRPTPKPALHSEPKSGAQGAAKQAAAARALEKSTERQAAARLRQERLQADQQKKTKPASKPLPVPGL